MPFLRSLLSVVLLATVLASPPARADDDAVAKGEMMVGMFARICPSVMTDGFVKMDVNDEALAKGLAEDACRCVDTRLRAVPPAEVAGLFGTDDNDTFNAIADACVTRAMKSRVGGLCRVYMLSEGLDDTAYLDTACTCVQQRTDATSEEAFLALMAGEDGGIEGLFGACEPDALPVPPKDPTP